MGEWRKEVRIIREERKDFSAQRRPLYHIHFVSVHDERGTVSVHDSKTFWRFEEAMRHALDIAFDNNVRILIESPWLRTNRYTE